MRLRNVLFMMVALILAACSARNQETDQTSTVTSERNTPQSESTQTESTPATEPETTETSQAPADCESLPEVTTEGEDGVTVPEDVLIVFQKTGGFAGISETTVIYADGSIENDENEFFQITPEEARNLVAAAEKGGFFDFARSYVPENHCCDYFNYSLTVRNCDQVATVLTSDEVPNSPAELQQLVQAIDLLVSNASAALPSNESSVPTS